MNIYFKIQYISTCNVTMGTDLKPKNQNVVGSNLLIITLSKSIHFNYLSEIAGKRGLDTF